ncbi:response regulator [Sandarakinorhabdus sp. DWP1-3-1]|uniref:response regulator n=1 Tax=Sandarakinorhabdus sp. DWP1-3-1 TaxID=2804627 RepID=UPI003CF0AE71
MNASASEVYDGPRCTCTVLIVEDDVLLRMMAADIVDDLGFAVREAASADEAILLLETHDDISIVFTDIQMPGSMNGLQLAVRTRQQKPAVGLVIVSGEHTPDADQIPDGALFFAKPYNPVVLQAALMQLSTAAPETHLPDVR